MFGTKDYKKLTKENIFEVITDYDIFKHYIKGFEELGKPFCSELREDFTPSCNIKRIGLKLSYMDFGNGERYDCFSYIMAKFNLTYVEALEVISNDFGLGLGVDSKIEKSAVPIILGRPPEEPKPLDIRINSKPWDRTSLEYWEQYEISQKQLEKYNIKPLKGYFMNEDYFNTSDLSFAYCFGNYKYKILRPYNEFKWLNNAGGIIQGLNQLTPGGTLLITSSLKDVIVIDGIGLKAIAPQSENTLLPMKKIEKFKEKFDKIILYYNNDEPGIKSSEEHSAIYNIPYIVHPEGEPKDPSDYVKKYNIKKYEDLLWRLIETETQETAMND